MELPRHQITGKTPVEVCVSGLVTSDPQQDRLKRQRIRSLARNAGKDAGVRACVWPKPDRAGPDRPSCSCDDANGQTRHLIRTRNAGDAARDRTAHTHPTAKP